MASLPDHVLDDQELLEGFALEAFEQAAAANLPALFPDATYRKRPDLLEGGVNAAWVMLPMRRPRYKRCSRTFNVTITPHMAEAIESFEDAPLSEYFQDQLGMTEGEDVEAEVHLYEVVAGGTAADIARSEAETPGLGAADEATLSQLQPLTHEAAGGAARKPGLGRTLPPARNMRTAGAGPARLPHGGRPAAADRARAARPAAGAPAGARSTSTLDSTRDRGCASACIFSEVKAQRLAVRLRQQSHAGSLAVAFTQAARPRAAADPARQAAAAAADRAPGRGARDRAALRSATAGRSCRRCSSRSCRSGWWRRSPSSSRPEAQKFLAAAEDPADGVTLIFTIEQPPGLKEIGAGARAEGWRASGRRRGDRARPRAPAVRVEAFAGSQM